MTNRGSEFAASSAGLLGDTPQRDYSRKLSLFNSFAEPELRALIANVALGPGMRILDAGCGTGQALPWLLDQVNPSGSVVGIDLALAHVEAARMYASANIEVIQGDLLTAQLPPASIDFVWCVNTINHFRDPLQAVSKLTTLLRPRGRIALGQSSLLPDMYFAWDSRLERLTNEAVRQYYCDRYSLDERDLSSVRAIVGVLRASNLRNVAARTVLIERMSPVDAATEGYLLDTIFRDTWGERLRPYLSNGDYAELGRLCDPQHPQFALRRPDFHFLQSFTLVTGEV
ncbi:MAG TPA: methyltransferase domain-containing protein [Steroidobacteraceae bacterium]|nr:methyltransferase domain-containing protein [Steroidobacteraceae bacterium]